MSCYQNFIIPAMSSSSLKENKTRISLVYELLATKRREIERAIRKTKDRYKILGFIPKVPANMPQAHCPAYLSAPCCYWIVEIGWSKLARLEVQNTQAFEEFT